MPCQPAAAPRRGLDLACCLHEIAGMTRKVQADKIGLPIPDREVAGRALARELAPTADGREVLVLALPRGGVPVAVEIAKALRAKLDLMLVRKLGTPGRPELAMGAIAAGGPPILNEDVVRAYGITSDEIAKVEEREREEIARRDRAYRGQRPRPELEGRIVVLVDDGLATGATMRAAIRAAREGKAHKVVVAVPVAPRDTVRQLQSEADEVHCLATPEPFFAIGQWYRRFEQVPDERVTELVEATWSRERAGHSSQPTAPVP